MSNSLDPDPARHFVGPNQGPNYLRKQSTYDNSWHYQGKMNYVIGVSNQVNLRAAKSATETSYTLEDVSVASMAIILSSQ